MSLIEISGQENFKSLLTQSGSSLVVIHFSAKWAPQCQQMSDVMEELLKDPKNSGVKFAKLEAEDIPELSEKYKILAVPTFIFFKNGAPIDRLDGANATELTKKVSSLSASSVNVSAPPDPPKQDLNNKLKTLVNAAPVMLFMKGSPEEPRCGFSRQTIELLNGKNIQYSTFNILTDDEVRQGLKKFSNWPTYPQLYSKGELLGGLDILKELAEAGELDELPKRENLNDRLKSLINRDPIMLFMKGSPTEAKCGFSRQTIAILQETGLKYGTFDILSDEDVRQGLKKYSNWPTYPQLYVNGELIGGLDIIKELKESGELQNILTEGQK